MSNGIVFFIDRVIFSHYAQKKELIGLEILGGLSD